METAAHPKERPCILIVDDNLANQVALEAVLGSSEYKLLTASSGPAALAIVENHEVALILLDIQMPEMDGYEVVRRLKAKERTRHIPVILVTAIYKEDPHIIKGYKAGAIDFFSKPFDPEILRLKVGIYAELYRKNMILQRKEIELSTILESIPDPVYVGNQTGITRCNEAARSMFGIDPSESSAHVIETLAERLKMRDAITGKAIPPADQPMAHALRGEQVSSQLFVMNQATGQTMKIACAASPVVFEGEIIGAVVVNTTLPAEPVQVH